MSCCVAAPYCEMSTSNALRSSTPATSVQHTFPGAMNNEGGIWAAGSSGRGGAGTKDCEVSVGIVNVNASGRYRSHAHSSRRGDVVSQLAPTVMRDTTRATPS